MEGLGFLAIFVILIFFIIMISSCIKIVPQAQAYILERLGGYQATWDVGIHWKWPIIDRVVGKVTLKEQVVDFAPQPVITKDNVTMRIDTVGACCTSWFLNVYRHNRIKIWTISSSCSCNTSQIH